MNHKDPKSRKNKKSLKPYAIIKPKPMMATIKEDDREKSDL